MAGTLDGLFGGGVKLLQKGYVSAVALTGAGEDLRYFDVTVSEVDANKTATSFEGGLGLIDSRAVQRMGTNSSYLCTTRMINDTTLRIASSASDTRIVGRWTAVESN